MRLGAGLRRHRLRVRLGAGERLRMRSRLDRLAGVPRLTGLTRMNGLPARTRLLPGLTLKIFLFLNSLLKTVVDVRQLQDSSLGRKGHAGGH